MLNVISMVNHNISIEYTQKEMGKELEHFTIKKKKPQLNTKKTVVHEMGNTKAIRYIENK